MGAAWLPLDRSEGNPTPTHRQNIRTTQGVKNRNHSLISAAD